MLPAQRVALDERREQRRAEAVARADGVRDGDRDRRDARVPVARGRHGAVRPHRDRDEPWAKAQNALEDVRELDLRVDPGGIVGAQLDDVDQRRESFESSAIRRLVAEDGGAHIRVEHDRPPPRFAFEQRLVGGGGRVDRQAKRPHVNRRDVLRQRWNRFGRQVGE